MSAGLMPRDLREWMRTKDREMLQVRTGVRTTAEYVAQTAVGELSDVVNRERARVPAAPVELTHQTYISLGTDKRFYGGVIIDFPDVTRANDATTIEIARYEIWGRKTPVGNATPDALTLYGTSEVSSVSAFGFAPGSSWDFYVRAIGVYTIAPGEYSAKLTATMLSDTTAPGQPTTPVATASRGSIKLTWNGKAVGGDMPLDLDYVIVAGGATSAPTTEIARFTPGPTNVHIVTGIPYNTPQFYRLRAVDTSGNMSPWSAQATATTTPLVDADIILSKIDAATTQITNIGAESIKSGAILADKLADNAVTLAKIADQAITGAKLHTDVNAQISKGITDAAAAQTTANTANTAAGTAQTAADAAKKLADAVIAARQNLLLNASFEEDNAHWNTSASSFTRASGSARTGSKVMFLKAAGSSNVWPTSVYSPSGKGRTFYVEGWFKRIGTWSAGRVAFVVQSRTTAGGTSGPIAGYVSGADISETVWTKVSTTYTIPDTVDATQTRFAPWAEGGANTACDYEVDDMLVVDVTDAKAALDAAKAAQAKADTAFADAQTALTNAGLAQTSANGKNSVYYGTTAPAGTGFKANDIWFKEPEYQIHRWVAGTTNQWVSSRDTTIKVAQDAADAATSAAAAADGKAATAQTAANTAKDLADQARAAITSGNLLLGGDFETTTADNTTYRQNVEKRNGSWAAKLPADTWRTIYWNRVPVTPGQVFEVRLWAMASGAVGSVAPSVALDGANAAGASIVDVYPAPGTSVIPPAAATFQEYVYRLTIPADVRSVRLRTTSSGATYGTGYWVFDDVTMSEVTAATAAAAAKQAADDAASVAGKALPKIILGATQKTFLSPTSISVFGSGVSVGQLIIQTPIPASGAAYMARIDVKGFLWAEARTELDCTVSFYSPANGTISNPAFSSFGSLSVSRVRLMTNAAGNLALVLTSATGNFNYIKGEVSRALIGHTLPPDSFATGWSMSIGTDLSALTLLSDLTSPRDLNDTHTLTQGWRTTGTTTIDGGKITADSVTAAQIIANAITATELAADAVLARNIKAGEIAAEKLIAGTLTSASGVFGDINASSITSGIISADRLDAQTIRTKFLTAGKITAGDIVAGTLTSASGVFGEVNANIITAGTLDAARLNAGDVRAKFLAAGKIVAAEMATGTITAESGVIGSLDIGKVTIGEMSGSFIKAKSLTAEQLLVARGGNDFIDVDISDVSGWNAPAYVDAQGTGKSGKGSILVPAGSGQLGNYYGISNRNKRVRVMPGQQWRIGAWVLTSADAPAGSVSLYARLYRDSDSTGTFATPSNISNDGAGTGPNKRPGAISAGVWTWLSGIVTIPDGDYTGMVLGAFKQSSYTTGTTRFSDIQTQLAYSGELIVDGAVTAEKVAANAITAKQLLVGDFANLAVGSDFEDTSAVPWAMHADHVIATTRSRSGTRSLRMGPIPAGTTNPNSSTLLVDYRVKEGEEWYYRLWVYLDTTFNGDSNSKLRVANAATGASVFDLPFNGLPKGSWQEVTGSYVVPAGVTALNVRLWNTSTSGFVFVDDVEVRRKSEASLIRNLGVEQLTAGTANMGSAVIEKIWTNVVRSRRITTDMLAVGKGINGIVDEYFESADLKALRHAEAGSWGAWGRNTEYALNWYGGNLTAGTARSFYFDTSADDYDKNTFIPVVEGQKWLLSLQYTSAVSGPRGTVRVIYKDGTISYTADGWLRPGGFSNTYNAPGTRQTFERIYTVPANVAYILPAIQFESTCTNAFVYGGATMTNMTSASLVVDGAISTKHLTVTEDMTVKLLSVHKVKAIEIDTNDLGADTGFIGVLKTNVLTADVINATMLKADAITAKHTITAATIQTESTALRGLKISTTGMKAYATSGQETLDFNAMTGNLSIYGGTLTGSTYQSTASVDRGIKISSTGISAYASNGVRKFFLDAAEGDAAFNSRVMFGTAENPKWVIVPWESAAQERAGIWLVAGNAVGLGGGETAGMYMENADNTFPNWLQLRGANGGGVELLGRMKNSDFYSGTIHHVDGLYHFQGANGSYMMSSLEMHGRLLTKNTPATTSTANAHIASADGTIYKSSSAARFKVDPQVMELADDLLDVPLKDWIDRGQLEHYQELDAEPRPHTYEVWHAMEGVMLDRIPGAIAEEVEAATGGDRFVTYDRDGLVESVNYDRFALARTAVLKRQLDEALGMISQLVERIEALEGA